MDALKLLAVLWRRRLAMVLSLVLFVGTAIFANLVLPEQWTAETQVIVESEDSTTSLLNDLGLSEMAMSLTTASDDIQNKIYLSTSRPVVDAVIWKLQLRNGSGELYEADDVADAGLLAPVVGTPSITVTQTEGTDVLVIEATGPSPEAARLMADTLAEVYIEQQTDAARAKLGEAQGFIDDQLAHVTSDLDRVYAAIAILQRETEIIDLDTEQRAAVARLSDLTMERELVFGKIKETQARITEAREYRSQESVDGVSSTSMQANPVIGKLRTQLADLYTTRQSLILNHHTARAPEVVEIDATIEGVKAQLAGALQEQAALDPAVAELEAEMAGLLERQRALTEAIERTQEQGATYPDLRRRFSRLTLEAAAAEEVYRSLQDQGFQIGIAQAMTMSDLRVTAPAVVPEDQSSPMTVLNVVAGILLGLAFGVASALTSEYVDDTVHAPEDVRTAWPLPQLGTVPKYKQKTALPSLVELSEIDPLAEAHRALRNGIEFASLDKPLRLLGVTSCIPGEGKSTLVANLGVSMAREGRRVLIVDADLRRPTQHRPFSLLPEPGLVDVLTRSVAPAEVIQGTPVENLWVLAAGKLPPNPAHLVESLRMHQTLLELARSYDIVIVDTPPVLAVNDPIVLGRLVDGLVLVVEAQTATRRMLAEARQRFEHARVNPIGFAMNKVRSSSLPYGQYARYYEQRPPAPPPPPDARTPEQKGAVS